MSINVITPNLSGTGTTKSLSGLSPARVLRKVARFLCQFAAAMTPHPKTIEVRMSNGTVLTNIPARVWDRHSALISARYDARRR